MSSTGIAGYRDYLERRNGAADLMHLQQDRVVVAIDEDFLHFLDIARLFAFAPELIAAAAEVDGAFGADGFVGVLEEGEEALGNDLPGEAVAIFQPSALLRVGIAARAEFFPVVVGFRLVLAHDLEGNGFAEPELRTAVEGGVFAAAQGEGDEEHLALAPHMPRMIRGGIAGDLGDP